MATKITNKQVKVISNVNFNNKEIENAIIDATKNNIKNVEGINKVDDVLVNGESVVENKVANISVPTKTSDIENDSGYITNAVDNLMYYPTTCVMEDADNNLQQQIDAITVASDVTDIVGTYADLLNYDTQHLKDNDIIKVLQDSTHNNASSYYRWSTHTELFTYIGSEGPYYTKSESDEIFAPQTRTINNKSLQNNINLYGSDITICNINNTTIEEALQNNSALNEFVITQEIFDEYKNENDYADLADIIDSEEITQNVINLNNFDYFLTGLVVSNKTLIFKNGTVVFGTSGINDSIDKAITASNCKLGFKDCEIIVNDSITTEPEKPVMDLNNTNLTFDNVIADNFIFTTFKTFIQTTNTCNIVLKDTLFNVENRIVSYDPEIDERRPSVKFIKVLTNGSSIEFVNSMVDIRTNNLIGEEGINEGLCQNIIVWVLDLYTAKLQVINSILQIIHGGHGEGGISSRPSRCFDVNLDNLDVVIVNSTIYGSAESFSVRNESSYALKIGKQFTTSDPYMIYLEPNIDTFPEDYEHIIENIDCDKYVIADTVNYIEGDYHFTYNGSSWDIKRTSFDDDDESETVIATDVSDATLESDYGITYELVQGKTLTQGDSFTAELTTHNQPYKILKNFTAEGNTPEYLDQLNYYIEEIVIPEDEQDIIDTVNYNRKKFADGLAATLERNGLHLRPHTEYDEDTDTETPVMAKIGFWYDEDNDDPNVWKIEIDSEWIEEDEHLMDDVNIVDDFGLEVVLHEGQTIPNLAGFTVIVEPCIEETKIYIKENINSVSNDGDYGDEEYFPVLEENDQPLGIFSGKEPKGFTQFRDLKTKNIKTETLTTTGNYYLPVHNENLESDNVKDAINELADREISANSLFDIKTIITPNAENNKGWACTCYDEPHKLNEEQVAGAYHEIENALNQEAESSFALDNKIDIDNIDVANMFYADGYYYFIYGSEGAYQGDIIVGRTPNIDGSEMQEVINLTSELSLSSDYNIGTCNVIQKDDKTFFVFYILNFMSDDYVVIFDKDWNIVMNYHSDESILPYYYITDAVLGKEEYSNKIFIPTIVNDSDDPDNYYTSVRLIIYDIEENTYDVVLKGFDFIYNPDDPTELFDFETVSPYTEFYDNKIWISTNQGAFSIDLNDDYNVHADFISPYYQDISGNGGSQIIGFDGDLYYLFSGNISTGSVFLVYKYNGETWNEWYTDERDDNEYTSLMTVQQHKDFLIVDTNTKIYLSRELNDLAELAEITNYGDMILADDILSVKNTVNFNGYSYFDIVENRIPSIDTYNINGEEVEITYYKCGNYKICTSEQDIININDDEYLVFGDLSNNNRVYSNFSEHNYIQLPDNLKTPSESRVFIVKFSTLDDVASGSQQCIFHSEDYLSIQLNYEGVLETFNYSTQEHITIDDDVQPNTDYWVKIIINGNNLEYLLSTDGSNFDSACTFTDHSLDKETIYRLTFGCNSRDHYDNFNGLIDFNEFKCYDNNELIYNGNTVNEVLAGSSSSNYDKLQEVYNYLGYLPYFWINQKNLDIVLPRNSNRWTMMYVGNNYIEEEMPEGNYSAFATKDELKNKKELKMFQSDYYETVKILEQHDIEGDIVINQETYLSQVTDDWKDNVFIYDGSDWTDEENNVVNLQDYGIDINGTTYSEGSKFFVYSACLRNKDTYTAEIHIDIISVYVNGILQIKKRDYTIDENNVITFNNYILKSTDNISVVGYNTEGEE